MSHRDSDSRRHRSGFDRESSPKRSRRDGKPTAERVHSDSNLDSRAHMDLIDQKHRRRLQDALPLEAAPKVESGVGSKDSDKKLGDKHSSDKKEVSRSKSYFQHDERASREQVGRNNGRKAAEHGWWKRAETEGERDKKSEAKLDGDAMWRQDKFSDVKVGPPSPVRKRPAFREKKFPVDSDKELGKQSHHHDRPFSGNEKREDRRQFDRPRRAPGREMQRERYGGGGGNYRGGDRSSGGRPTRHDKWSHDLFDEANKSPPRKNEDEQIAKVESLLAL